MTQTNLYSVQETSSSVNTNCSELEQFIGILIYMGIIVMPSYTDYWAQATNSERVSQIFSLKRFQKLRRYIHFSNNENSGDSEDRLLKIRPVFDIIVENCRKLEQEQEHSIDEMMVPYKGTRAGNLRQYIQNKPHKWGYKIFMRTGVSGLIYDFLPYTGKGMATNLTAEEKIFGIGGQVVIMLCKSLPPDMNVRVYFDNFFCTLELIIFLKNRNIDSLGTLRKNRLKGCPLEEEKVLQKRGRGMYDYRKDVTSDVIVVRWVDNKVVCMASSFCGIQPLSTVKRWNTNEKRKTDVPCPNIVTQYNKHMGGVDLAGMLIELYRTPLKSKRWYLRLFAFSIDLCVVNAWLLYRRETGDRKTSLKLFRADIANALMTSNKRKAGRPSTDEALPQPKKKATIPIPVQDTRYDCVDHWPEYGAKGRCRYCPKGYSTVRCTKCGLVLCFVPGRNCFRAFHTKK